MFCNDENVSCVEKLYASDKGRDPAPHPKPLARGQRSRSCAVVASVCQSDGIRCEDIVQYFTQRRM